MGNLSGSLKAAHIGQGEVKKEQVHGKKRKTLRPLCLCWHHFASIPKALNISVFALALRCTLKHVAVLPLQAKYGVFFRNTLQNETEDKK